MKWRAELRAQVVEGAARAPCPVDSLLARATGSDALPPGVAGVLEAHAWLNRQGEVTVLVLDDVDTLAEEDQQAWDALLRCLEPDDAVLMLGAARLAPELRSPSLVCLPLEPLAQSDLSVWATGLIAAAQVAELFSLTAGIPAQVEIVLRQLVSGERTIAELGEGPARLPSQGPPELAAAGRLGAELAALAEAELETLALVAVLDGVLEPAQALVPVQEDALAALAAAGWLRREGSEWRLWAVADASVLCAALPRELVKSLHQRLAAALRSRAPRHAAAGPRRASSAARGVAFPSAPAHRARWVHHLAAAGELEAAEKHFLECASEQALAPRAWSSNAQPLEQYTRQADVLLDLARVHLPANRPARALSTLAHLLRLHRAEHGSPRSCELAGRCLHALGRSKRAQRYLERALLGLTRNQAASSGSTPEGAAPPHQPSAMPGQADPSGAALWRASTVEVLVRVHIQRGNYQQARELACRELESCTEPRLRASLCQSLGVAASYLGDVGLGREQLEQALALFDRSGSAEDRMRSLSYLAILEFRVGHLETAIGHYRAAVELAETHQLTPLLSSALLNLGTACQRQGDWGAALDYYERALRLASALGRTSTEATLRLNLANLHTEIGAFDRGLAGLGRVEALAQSAGLSHLGGTILVIRGEVALARGELDRAHEHFLQAQRFHRERQSPREVAEAELHLAEVELALGNVAAAAERAAAASLQTGALDAADLDAQAAMLQGRCALARGGWADAAAALERAVDQCVRAAQQLLEADAQALLAQALRASGNEDRAQEHQRRALAIWERVAHSLPQPLRDAFWRHPRRAALGSTAASLFPAPLAPTLHPTADRATLTRFLEVNQRINSSLSTERLLEFAMDAAIELSGAERGFVLLAEPTQEQPSDPPSRYQVAVARNLDRERVGSSSYELSTSIAERVMRTGQPIITVDAQSDERFAGHHSVHAMRLQSVACVPISSPEGVLGALYLDNRYQAGRFSSGDAQLLMAFSTQVAIALRNARMHAALQEHAQSLAEEKRAVEKVSRGQAKEIERLHREVAARQQALELRYDYGQIVGRSAPMRELLAKLDRVIDTPLTVLIQGESGTGKELVARAVHYNSSRRERPFVSINCAAMPEALLESELFGHVRGAFTGATDDKQGLMVAARGGTLFLDEVGDMPPSMQVKLLRALQEREVRPVGAAELVPIDVRVLSATNKDLGAEVQSGGFREDLFYLLSVVVIELPPLRERSEDIPALGAAILERLVRDSATPPPALSPAALRALMGYRWPGNVRQLENVLSKAYYWSNRVEILSKDVELPTRLNTPRRALDRAQFERDEARRIVDALHQSRWNMSAVARSLGIPRNTLYRKLGKYRIARPAGQA